MVSDRDGDVLEALVIEAGRVSGLRAVPRLLRAAAALVEHAGYEIAKGNETARVTQVILLAAELERLCATLEKADRDALNGAPWQSSSPG
ncbi:DNA primase [Salipiger sp. 1_MG-2023]|uniref:DNA primase n=1 Tax=Salipiger sp. 1_MG-2023 TaxID=3062665 RepID=UPI0026E3D628|nr:DNA primase [Salipiger sp. 1_MG-2023]MDO6587644.1 DNA primase [Salipiger sp. 1_MG-2023]